MQGCLISFFLEVLFKLKNSTFHKNISLDIDFYEKYFWSKLFCYIFATISPRGKKGYTHINYLVAENNARNCDGHIKNIHCHIVTALTT